MSAQSPRPSFQLHDSHSREEQELGLMERWRQQRQGSALGHMLAWNLGPGTPGTSLAPPPSDTMAPSQGILISLLGSAEDCHPLTSLDSIYGFSLSLAWDSLPAALLLCWSVLCWENQQERREDALPTSAPLPTQGLAGLASSSLSSKSLESSQQTDTRTVHPETPRTHFPPRACSLVHSEILHSPLSFFIGFFSIIALFVCFKAMTSKHLKDLAGKVWISALPKDTTVLPDTLRL